MALLEKMAVGAPSLSSQTPTPENQFDSVAGEDIAAGDACYLDGDGLLYRAYGSWPAATSRVVGFAADAKKEGYPLTVYRNVYFAYSDESGADAAVPGDLYFISSDSDEKGRIGTTENGYPCALGALDGNVIVSSTWDKYID